MFMQRIIQGSLLAGLVLGITGVASAHVFPRVPTRAERAAERERVCAEMAAGVTHRNRFVRFGSPAEHSAAADIKRKATAVRFGPASPPSHLVCRTRSVAMLGR